MIDIIKIEKENRDRHCDIIVIDELIFIVIQNQLSVLFLTHFILISQNSHQIQSNQSITIIFSSSFDYDYWEQSDNQIKRQIDMTEEKENVHSMIKTHINRTKSIWKSEDENDISKWNKFHDWKLWSSFKEKILIIKSLINTQELTNLLHAERKIAFIIFRFVRCTNAAFEILILLNIINTNLKVFYSLNFNLNEKLLQFSRRSNLNHAWFINDKIIEYKQYRFEKNLNEMKDTIRINKSNVSIESITTNTFLTLSSNVNYSTSVIISVFTENRFITTFSRYSVIRSMTAQSSLFSKKKINDNKEKSSENHDFTSLFRSFEMTLIETTSIDMSSKNEKIKEYDETAKHKKILIVLSTYKIVQLTLIEKRFDNTTVKLSET